MIPDEAVEAMFREAARIVMNEPTQDEFALTGHHEPLIHTDGCSCDYQEVREPADIDGRVAVRLVQYVTRKSADCAIHGDAA